jgi:hypothetical protein
MGILAWLILVAVVGLAIAWAVYYFIIKPKGEGNVITTESWKVRGAALCYEVYGNDPTGGKYQQCLEEVTAEALRAEAAGEEFNKDNVPSLAGHW